MDRSYNGGIKAMAALFALIMLTQLDGTPVLVESTQIVIITQARPGHKMCGDSTGAGIRVGATGLCVRETQKQIEKMVRDAK